MTKVDQPKVGSLKPAKPQSRLSELAAARVVTAGEAFEHDLQGHTSRDMGQGIPPAEAALPGPISTPLKKAPTSANSSIKRTFRYPKGLDSELKKFVHRYNLEKPENDPELSMEEVGILMAKHFLASDPTKIVRESRGQ